MDSFKTNYDNWGICDKFCESYFDKKQMHGGYYETPGKLYTEATIDILGESECKNKDKDVDVRKEFCAGGRIEVNVELYRTDL